MDIRDIRRRLAEEKPTVGSWLQLPDANVAEIMAQAGYDWIAIDIEHGSFGVALLPDIIRGIQCGGAVPFARLPKASKVWIKSALEAGAEGLIFPMIESADELAAAIDLATYPDQPQSRMEAQRRGIGFCRANGFGKFFRQYMEEIAPDIFIVAQIEHIRAVQELPEILDIKRLDAIMVGPYDLSGSMGLTGQFEHPEFQAVMKGIAQTCKEKKVLMGTHIVTPDPHALEKEIASGARFIAYGIDSVFLWEAAKAPSIAAWQSSEAQRG